VRRTGVRQWQTWAPEIPDVAPKKVCDRDEADRTCRPNLGKQRNADDHDGPKDNGKRKPHVDNEDVPSVRFGHDDLLVAGWSIHHRQDRHMVVRAVQMAVWQRSGSSEVILHSDRGGQFISGTCQKFLGGNALVCSMSAVGHCADNAACEASSACSSGNACIIVDTVRATRHERTCSITSSGFTTRECVVEWRGTIGSFWP
jgi:hypothetical protein